MAEKKSLILVIGKNRQTVSLDEASTFLEGTEDVHGEESTRKNIKSWLDKIGVYLAWKRRNELPYATLIDEEELKKSNQKE